VPRALPEQQDNREIGLWDERCYKFIELIAETAVFLL
jgi:hypothetical protein